MKEISTSILIVDDEKNICEALSYLIKKEGFKALVAYDGYTALEMISFEKPDVMLLDIVMPGMDGMEVLKRAKVLDLDLPVIIITAHADIPGAVSVIKDGAHDYIAKPFDNNEVIRSVHRAITERQLRRKVKELSTKINENYNLSEVMGPSNKISRLIFDVNSVAKSNFSIIILGETGSGKELIANAIHQASPRSKLPFLPVDCGAIPESLLESELFGYEKGAFTGAQFQQHGKFEVAQGGTLFLDEISNLPMVSQPKLLRALQNRNIYRVGGTKPVNIDVRIIVASNRDLEEEVVSGSFRQDLFFRLNEFTIKIPPLRERVEDIIYLAKKFLDTTNMELNKSVKRFSESALETLLSYDWPGNVRQLQSTVRRAVLLADEIITENHLDLKMLPSIDSEFALKIQNMPYNGLSLKKIVHHYITATERKVIVQVLKYTGGNKAKAARLLHVDYKTLHTKVKKLGISTKIGGIQ